MGCPEPKPKGDYRWVSEASGIYPFHYGDQIVYVGQTNNLRAQLEEHERNRSHMGSNSCRSTRWVNTRGRKRMEDKAIAYSHPTRTQR
jgi:hypothetical protein